MDLNQFVNEPLLSLIFSISETIFGILSQSSPPACLQFDELLARNINAHLSNFSQSGTFKFQSLLMKMFFSFNDDDMQLSEKVLMKDMHKDYCKFMNSLMDPVYEVLFKERLPRVLPDMKSMLKSSPKRRVKDWFLSEDNIVIRVYGFTRQPYVLPAFLTFRMFALELIRQRLTAKNEHFIGFRKHANIKFPWEVGPFTVKIKLALSRVESLLRDKGFTIKVVIDYDPHHIISNRIQANNSKPFEHVKVEGLVERAN